MPIPGLLCKLAISACVAGLMVLPAAHNKKAVNHFFMRFFRDLSRSKARRRKFGMKNALMPILMGNEEALPIPSHDEGEGDALWMTASELAHYRGQDDGVPLYLSIQGRIYDVTKGTRFYGPGADYHKFVGIDATRAFATGCLQDDCLNSSTEGLTEQDLKELQRWIELYETHDKYTFVGYLIDDPVDRLLAQDEEAETSTKGQGVESDYR